MTVTDKDPADVRPADAGPALLAVVGTDTEVGKTWFSAALIRELRNRGLGVSARKPVQSFDPADNEARDADILAEASGEDPRSVCEPQRCYPAALAPPMAAQLLGLPSFTTADLLAEISWPVNARVRLVETVGGVRSPISHDGDSLDLVRLLEPSHCVLVADAGLGTINAVRLSLNALAASLGRTTNTLVFLNRFDGSDLHRRNLHWLRERDGLCVTTEISTAADWAVTDQAVADRLEDYR